MKRIVSVMRRQAFSIFAMCAATAISLPAQTFTPLLAFDFANGGAPEAPLVQGTDGDLYGTTGYGGANTWGTVFKITPSGTLTSLYSFCSQTNCTDGRIPLAGLVQGTDGNFYGTTSEGVEQGCTIINGCGTVFKITPAGALTTLYSFSTGVQPRGALVQAPNGDFYGTTNSTVFKITPSGTLTALYTFCSQMNCLDGSSPNGLILAASGDFYGTTESGGANNFGTVFKLTPSGELTTLHSFCAQGAYPTCSDGESPYAGLVQATNGDFYGTTGYGGTNGAGTVFEITPAGTLTTLYAFCSQSQCADGDNPLAALIQTSNGDFYGTTSYGGPNAAGGTIFEITPSGTLTTLHGFCWHSDCTTGSAIPTGLVQATNGHFYGGTEFGGRVPCDGGRNGCGTVFSLSVGLGPFVKTQTTAGPVGAAVNILGTNLTGSTSVSFNGTAAAFTVVSPSLITTTVPAGATTGKIKVVTPGGTLSSNVPFEVLP